MVKLGRRLIPRLEPEAAQADVAARGPSRREFIRQQSRRRQPFLPQLLSAKAAR